MNSPEEILISTGLYLKNAGYHFVTPTPESHRRVLQRVEGDGGDLQSLRDALGWSRPFKKNQIPRQLAALLNEADVLEEKEGLLKSKIRFSTLEDDLFLHSAYPTVEPDSVFFGPDTYRFAALICRELGNDPTFRVNRLIDVGCGSGAGAITALNCLSGPAPELVFADINPRALRFSRVNAELAGVEKKEFILSDVLKDVPGTADLIISNPPYLFDTEKRVYRHGGENFGCALSARIAAESLKRLRPGGKLILYTGSPVIDGDHVLLQLLRAMPEFENAPFQFGEIDPDVFGEELEKPHYKRVERIAAVSIIVTLPRREHERRNFTL